MKLFPRAGVSAFRLLLVLLVLAAAGGAYVVAIDAPAQYPGDVPRGLGPSQYFTGTPWQGNAGITESVASIMARAAREAPITGPLRERRREQAEKALRPKRQSPFAIEAPQMPAPDPGTNIREDAAPAFSSGGVSFIGITSAESGFIPPDTMGAVGPTQVMLAANGRIKVFDKTGALGPLNVTDQAFFASVVGSDEVSDPHVRYDRLSQRWFVSEITVPLSFTGPNKILIAVSSGPTITGAASFTFYAFQQDLVGPQPNIDTNGFADYDTLGIDRHALYIGANIFNQTLDDYVGSTGWVINKANLLAGTLTVTAFRGLNSLGTGFAGVYTPQGVDNDDPASTEGYFIGVDGAAFSLLVMKRILNPGSVPSISGDLNLSVASTWFPVDQVALGSVRPLDALDDRLFAAHVKKNTTTGISSLWTAHNIAVTSSGVGSSGGDRNGSRWYQIDSLSGTPVITQAGTVFNNAVTSPRGFWIPTIAANGQGHAAIGGSHASDALPAGIFMSSRNVNDPVGTMGAGAFSSEIPGCVYNAQTGPGPAQRWGDYSQVVVDPIDNMTLWSFQELCSSANNWGVFAQRLIAPPPATPASATSVPTGRASATIVVTGSFLSGSGFYDPGADAGGPGFTNHLTASISGGVVVNSVTRVERGKVTLNVNTTGASAGTKNITITNPDGQFLTGSNILTVTSAPTSTLTRTPAVLNFAASKNGQFGSLGVVTAPQAVTVGFTGIAPSWTATSDQAWAVVTSGSGTGSGQFTVSISNAGNVIGANTAMTASVVISSPTAAPVVVTVNLTVQQSLAAGALPFGQVETPAQNATALQGAIGVTGWALDDRGVTTVKVYRPCLAFDNPAACHPVGGNSLVYIGDAAFLAGARPDVEVAFATTPLAHRAGWGFQILTNMLPHIPNMQAYGGQGTFVLYAYATDLEGQITLLGRTYVEHTPTTISVNNAAIAKPFGTIDTPGIGGTVSGTVPVFGWSLTPDLNTVPDGTDILIPTNGSTMVVFIDSIATATVAYNHCRGTVGTPPPGVVFCNDDIANIFGNLTPQAPLTPRASNPTRFRNLDAGRGAIAVYDMNTLALANGLHTIAWSVTDSASRVEGIGSRFFIVLNGGTRPATKEALLDAPAASRGAASSISTYRASNRRVAGRTGFDLTTPMTELTRGKDGARSMTIALSGRAEIAFANPVDAGYLVANGELRDLPVGSHLDHRTGVFGWVPPPGYFGTYRLVFLIGSERVDVDVTITDVVPGRGRGQISR